jgi:hypothetical protein
MSHHASGLFAVVTHEMGYICHRFPDLDQLAHMLAAWRPSCFILAMQPRKMGGQSRSPILGLCAAAKVSHFTFPVDDALSDWHRKCLPVGRMHINTMTSMDIIRNILAAISFRAPLVGRFDKPPVMLAKPIRGLSITDIGMVFDQQPNCCSVHRRCFNWLPLAHHATFPLLFSIRIRCTVWVFSRLARL